MSLVDRIVGANTPDKRANVGLAFDSLTLISSLLLLFFLFGYFDGRFTRTGEAAPPVIYFVYVFLGLTAAWQLLSLIVGLSHKSKLRGRGNLSDAANKSANATGDSGPAETPQGYLPPANVENMVPPPSAYEDTTRQLDKTRRK